MPLRILGRIIKISCVHGAKLHPPHGRWALLAMTDSRYHSISFYRCLIQPVFYHFERALAWGVFKLSREREEMACLSNVESVGSSVTPPCVDFISKWDGPSRTNPAIFYTSATQAFSQTNQETAFPAAPLVHSSPIKKWNSKMLSLKEEINDPNFLCLGVSSPVELRGTSETNQVLGRGFVGGLGFHRDEEINDTNYLNKGLISGATSSTKSLRISNKTNEGEDHPGKKKKKQRPNNTVLEKGKAPMLNDDY